MAKRPDLLALLKDLKMDPEKFASATDERMVSTISAALRAAAGHTVANVVLRRAPNELSHKQIFVRDPGVFRVTSPGERRASVEQVEDIRTESITKIASLPAPSTFLAERDVSIPRLPSIARRAGTNRRTAGDHRRTGIARTRRYLLVHTCAHAVTDTPLQSGARQGASADTCGRGADFVSR